MKKLLLALPLLMAGCVPSEVHRADQQRIAELLARVAELQNSIASLMASQRVLEMAIVAQGILLAVCLATLWLRRQKRGGPN